VTAVVLDALAGVRDPQLRVRLGPAADDELQRVLRDRARAWAGEAGGAPALEVERVDELAAALEGRDGPVLLVAPDVPALSERHLAAALEDLRAGVLLSIAPTGDGTPFLVALARPEPDLLALMGAPFEQVTAAAVARGSEMGLLRSERRLATLADARAIRADPLAPPGLRGLLGAL
jgi:glycosyltransferase A (GT-A) superfamily protein (DUF2064 family)